MKEAEACLRTKIAGFQGLPDLPDLEEGSFQLKEEVYVDIYRTYIICAFLALTLFRITF